MIATTYYITSLNQVSKQSQSCISAALQDTEPPFPFLFLSL
jgi:hypothetical protein